MIKGRRDIAGHELYHFTTCPYCLSVRLFAWWTGLKIPLKDIMLNRENHAALIAGGGKAQVPCLRIEQADGDIRWLYESADIIRYLKSELT